MPELSPAAQAVWDAAWANTPVRCGDIEGTRRAQVAAALRAAALYCKQDKLILLSIADELEAQ